MPSVAAATVKPARRVKGRVHLSGDKSISHRYAMLAALAQGRSTIERYSSGADCAATLECLRNLGVDIQTRRWFDGSLTVKVMGRGLRGLQFPGATFVLDAQNSGTTMRLLAGVLAGQPFMSRITGDESLRRRPMRRVAEPLELMGAVIASEDGYPPLVIHGTNLELFHGITYDTPVPSAQIKSAVLLAGLQARGTTVVREPVATRNHTELALRAFGAEVKTEDTRIELEGMQQLTAGNFIVPGDVSSAAFWLAAAAALPGSDVEIENVGLNPTRTALLRILERAGADVQATIEREAGGEPSGRVRVRFGDRIPLQLTADEVPLLIDEIPALAAWAALGGDLHVTGAGELRVKESDRITCLVRGFQALGADVEEFPDGFHVRGSKRLSGGQADAVGDHRLAMSFSIAALGAEHPSTVAGSDSVAISYPDFFNTLERLCE
jgi:3-phosphoshikimate 1-carboxyvinyltransferase